VCTLVALIHTDLKYPIEITANIAHQGVDLRHADIHVCLPCVKPASLAHPDAKVTVFAGL
jgi:hypothetical protein